jgi:hypothetical protein
VPFHYAPDNCKAYSRSLKFLFTMEPLKYLEEFAVVPHIEAHAVISNKKYQFAGWLGLASNLDFGSRAVAREFKSIRHKVLYDLPQHGLVGSHFRQTAYVPMNTPIASFRFQFPPHLFDNVIQVHRHLVNLIAPKAGKLEQIVD